MEYQEARREAQLRANDTGGDYGVEKLGAEYRYFPLPQRRHRFGFELRCEVVSCTDIAKCRPGHGPNVATAPGKRRVKIEGERVLLDGRPIGKVAKGPEGWTSTHWPNTHNSYPARSYAAAILGCVHSYASWIGWHAVIVERWR